MKTNKNLTPKILAAIAVSSIAFSSVATTLPVSASHALPNPRNSKTAHVYKLKTIDGQDVIANCLIDNKNHALILKPEFYHNIVISAQGQQRLILKGINKIVSSVPLTFSESDCPWHEYDYRGFFFGDTCAKVKAIIWKILGVDHGSSKNYILYITPQGEKQEGLDKTKDVSVAHKL